MSAQPGRTQRAYNVWTEEERDALRRGVAKHGLGAWEQIRKDPEFCCLEKRSGVQLKDKFRNLVKFRHLDENESKQLKPKATGPWSRRYNSSGSNARDRSQTRSPSHQSSPGPTPDKEHAEMLLALENCGRSVNEEDTHSEGEGLHAKPRKRRRTLENCNFGIYDQRRYNSGNSVWMEGETPPGLDSAGSQGPSKTRSQKGRGRGRRGRRSRVDDFDDEDSQVTEEEDMAELEAIALGSQRRSSSRRNKGSNSSRGAPMNDEELAHATWNCLCGNQQHLGTEVVQCEDCGACAHASCVRLMLASDPLLHLLDPEATSTYKCPSCRARTRAHTTLPWRLPQPACTPPPPCTHSTAPASPSLSPLAYPHSACPAWPEA